jgi:hypothetical protein
MTDDMVWQGLTDYSEAFTCYSAAVAAWVAAADASWARTVDPGLWLALTEEDDGLFGFGHFPPALRPYLGLVRTGSDDPQQAVEGILAELARSGRVIVAGDGFNLPWHVAYGRVHVPHWFVLTEGPEVVDPFACRNELGVQVANRQEIDEDDLATLGVALPGDDPVLRLRESLALGDVTPPRVDRYQWLVSDEVGDTRPPQGPIGPDAVRRLARHFRERGQSLDAYRQADDMWSIARHRAFLVRHAAERGADEWVEEHGAPLARRWGHIAPLVMQATLALGAGRAASASVQDTLEELADREAAAAAAFPPQLGGPPAGQQR